MAFFAALFAARTDIYSVRWDNARTGQKGCLPVVRGGWRKGSRHAERDYLPLTAQVLAAHLSGDEHVGLPAAGQGPVLVAGRRLRRQRGDAGRAEPRQARPARQALRGWRCPGRGPSPAWIFFTAPVPAQTARRPGAGLLRAMALGGQMSLASYDRLFPSQDTLPSGGVGT